MPVVQGTIGPEKVITLAAIIAPKLVRLGVWHFCPKARRFRAKAASGARTPMPVFVFHALWMLRRPVPHLSHLSQGRRGDNPTRDEPFAWHSREFLRKKCIGQVRCRQRSLRRMQRLNRFLHRRGSRARAALPCRLSLYRRRLGIPLVSTSRPVASVCVAVPNKNIDAPRLAPKRRAAQTVTFRVDYAVPSINREFGTVFLVRSRRLLSPRRARTSLLLRAPSAPAPAPRRLTVAFIPSPRRRRTARTSASSSSRRAGRRHEHPAATHPTLPARPP